VTKLTVHVCSKCGEQTIWSPNGPLHNNDSIDHLPEPGRILTLEWDQASGTVVIEGDEGQSA
jgi:hypothetical protein